MGGHLGAVRTAEVVPQLFAVRLGSMFTCHRPGAVAGFFRGGHETGIVVMGAGFDRGGVAGIERQPGEWCGQRWTMEVAGRVTLIVGDDPVGGGHQIVAGHRLQDLAQVDHERVRNDRHIDPLAIRVLDLQARSGARCEHCQETSIVVRIHTGAASGRWRVMDELGQRHWLVAEQVAQMVCFQAEADR